jgi:hypothetical protein
MSNNSDEFDSIDDTPGLSGADANDIESSDGCFESDEDCTGEIREEPSPRQKKDEKRWRARQRSRRSRATLSLGVMATEYVWLWDVRHGVGMNEIAMREGVTYRRVRQGVGRARALEKDCQRDSATVAPPPLIPLFPIASYTPQSACAHHQPIQNGSLLCCMVCHRSGVDDHPSLLRSPLTDPAPEPKAAPEPISRKRKRETRKERRQRLFGTTSLASSA